jgi:hypothetical protein
MSQAEMQFHHFGELMISKSLDPRFERNRQNNSSARQPFRIFDRDISVDKPKFISDLRAFDTSITNTISFQPRFAILAIPQTQRPPSSINGEQLSPQLCGIPATRTRFRSRKHAWARCWSAQSLARRERSLWTIWRTSSFATSSVTGISSYLTTELD